MRTSDARRLSRGGQLGAAVLALLLAALALPAVPQADAYHAFADQVTRWGLPHALDVLSNLGFAGTGLLLLTRLQRVPQGTLHPVESGLLGLAGVGLLATAVASAAYHLAPDDAGLVWDRVAMVLPFAALLGLAACRVSHQAGLALGMTVLCAGMGAVAVWSGSGNLTPWVVVQTGGALLMAGLAAVKAPGSLPVRWHMVLALYAAAKLLEVGDHLLWDVTGGLVSGHALKHLVAAAAILPLAPGLQTQTLARQNASRRHRASAH